MARATSLKSSPSTRLLAAFRLHTYFVLLKPNLIMLGTIFLIVLVLMLLGAIPTWPHSRNWGYGPSGGVGLIVIILLILALMGRI